MNVGVTVQEDANGKPYAYFIAQGDGISVSMYFCSADDVDEATAQFIAGLKQLAFDLKQMKSGLVKVQEIPAGLNGFKKVR